MSARRRRRSSTRAGVIQDPPAETRRAPGPQTKRTRGRWSWIGIGLLVAVLLAGAALRVWLSFNDDGMYWPDEIYQSLEPAHRLVFGYGLVAHEFIEGARNWAFPGTIAALLKLASVLGLDEPRSYLALVRLALSVVSVATAYASYRLARAYGASTLAAAAGASLYALGAPAIYFAPRALSETASALPVALGLAFALRPGNERWERVLGASLLGLAVLFRLQNGIFAIGLLGVYAMPRHRARLRDVAIVLAAWAVVYGLVDQLTWGRAFQSAEANIAFNLATPNLTSTIGNTTVSLERELYFPPIEYYLRALLSSMGVTLVAALALATLSLRRAPDLAIVAIAFFAVHSLIPHKELRFVIAALPLLGALAAIGLDELRVALRRRSWTGPALAGLFATACAVSGATFHDLRFGDVGFYGRRASVDQAGALHVTADPNSSAYDDPGAVDRLLMLARTIPDLCGIKVESALPGYQGGYTYLHRDVPLYRLGGPPRTSPFFNYVIALHGDDPPAQVRAREGDIVLLRLRDTCTRDPAFDFKL